MLRQKVKIFFFLVTIIIFDVFGNEFVLPESINSIGDGSFEDITNSQPATIIIDKAIIVGGTVTVSEYINFKFIEGGYFYFYNNASIEIFGTIEAGPYKTFEYTENNKVTLHTLEPKTFITPHWWGSKIDQNGNTDWSDALQNAINVTIDRKNNTNLHGGTRSSYFNNIDLKGAEYKISKSIIIDKKAGGFTISNGVIKCNDNFPEDDFLIYLKDTYTKSDIRFDNLLFDGASNANGLLIGNHSKKITVSNCKFVDHKSNCIKIKGAIHNGVPGGANGLVETFIQSSVFVNHDVNNNDTAINIEYTSDSHIDNNIIHGVGMCVGIFSNGSCANLYTKNHIYSVKNFGMYFQGNTDANRILENYFDKCNLGVENPAKSIIKNNYFLHTNPPKNFIPLLLKATGGNSKDCHFLGQGLIISNNTFEFYDAPTYIDIVSLKNNFPDDRIRNVYINDNIIAGNIEAIVVKKTRFFITIPVGSENNPAYDVSIDFTDDPQYLFGQYLVRSIMVENWRGGGAANVAANLVSRTFTTANISFSNPVWGNVVVEVELKDN